MGDFTDMLRNGYDQLSDLCGVPNVTEPFVDNTTPDENDDGRTFLDYFIENTKVVGEQIFLTQPMGEGKVLTWTYSEVLEQAQKAAGYISVRTPFFFFFFSSKLLSNIVLINFEVIKLAT